MGGGLELDEVARRRVALGAGDDGFPGSGGGDLVGVGARNGDGRRVVASEEGSVDFDGGDSARRDAELDDDPVVGLRVVTAGLPAGGASATISGETTSARAGGRDWQQR